MESDRQEPLEADEYEVDSSEDQDLEAAMREALEAVESARVETGETKEDDAGSGESSATLEVGEGSLDELTMLRKEVAELRDRSVRTLADFDNFRKRAERERDEQRRYAGTEVLRDVLPVVDNLERALESNGDNDEMTEGVELILRQVLDMLRRHGVVRVEAQGQAFDPGVHEAVSRQESEEVDVPTVSEELQAGYVLKDRLLRPAMVVVTVSSSPANEDEGSGESGVRS
jgi:molecular chaperone GrpE